MSEAYLELRAVCFAGLDVNCGLMHVGYASCDGKTKAVSLLSDGFGIFQTAETVKDPRLFIIGDIGGCVID